MKYKLVTPNPDIQNDESVLDTWDRIAGACARAEIQTYGYNQQREEDEWDVIMHQRFSDFQKALYDFGFLPAGRITSGAGSARSVTLFNCFVMGTIPDSMVGIFDMLKEAALTMQQGGGIGYDFSPIRPKGARVKGVDADASGPISFMNVWDSMCRTIMSAGSRRGAMMATIRCDHPDVMDFITAKKDPAALRMFNMSVLCTDAFMEAVRDDLDWPLVHDVPPQQPVMQWTLNEEFMVTEPRSMIRGQHIYAVVKAKDLWNAIMQSTYDQAEPGVIFIDRINNMNNLQYMETIAATNPCGEQPLPPYGACLLGSINLTQVIENAFEFDASINYGKLDFLTEQAVTMLDSVIDISNFPLPQQRAEAKEKRRMGLGITGLANLLFMLNVKYGSKDAEAIADDIMMRICLKAYRTSIELAKEFGPCPATNSAGKRESFVKSGFFKSVNMPKDIVDGILEHGIRNALLTSIAPTGTISLYAGNVSSGIEPVFAAGYTRKVLLDDGSKREERVEDYGVMMYRTWTENNGMDVIDYDNMPETFVTAQTLTPMDHLVMQAAVQKWTDSSISKTVNLPEDISFEDFQEVYLSAYHMGCKGCTTYRPNEITGSVLSVDKPKEETPMEEPGTFDEEAHQEFIEGPSLPDGPIPRDSILNGQTYKLKWDNTNFYVTINNTFVDGKIIPFEIFINTQDMSHFQWTQALTRMMSSVFRRGGDISFVIDDLKSIMDPNGGAWIEGRYVPSFIALLGSTLQKHLDALEMDADAASVFFEELVDQVVEDINEAGIFMPGTEKKPLQCQSCKSFNVHMLSGCPTCGDCGYSKCG
jgi:ribonucleoside-diphosphate reductase alpha chain